jgi:2'-5' RNA ligase
MAGHPSALPYPDADALSDHWWWRPGWRVGTRFYTWHVTVADLPRLADHVAAYQGPLRQFPFLDPIPREWLHITVQGLGHANEISPAERDAVVAAVGGRLESFTAPRLVFGRPVLHGEAVVLPPADPGPLTAIRDAIRAGIEDAYGPAEGDPTRPFRPHASLAYVNAPADVAPVRAALDTVQAEPVDVTLTHLSLIELHRDNRMYMWTTVATVPVGS